MLRQSFGDLGQNKRPDLSTGPPRYCSAGFYPIKRAISCWVGRRPSGVSWSTVFGRSCERICEICSFGSPKRCARASMMLGSIALEIWPGVTASFEPVPIHELIASPKPFCWNCLSKPPKPPSTSPGDASAGDAEAGFGLADPEAADPEVI